MIGIQIQKADEAKQYMFPDWIKLQNDISESITDLLIAMDEGDVNDLNERLAALNGRIAEYNLLVPSIHLKKPLLTLGQLAKQAYMWV